MMINLGDCISTTVSYNGISRRVVAEVLAVAKNEFEVWAYTSIRGADGTDRDTHVSFWINNDDPKWERV